MTYTFVNVEVKSAGLKVTKTDATNEHFPTNTTSSTPDEEGKQFYYRPVRKLETKYNLYCTKLGAVLARELKKTDSNIVIPNDVITDLPKGYQLFEHVKNYIHEPKKYRTDTYLFGFGSIKFRSPAEFENHLLWLASDQSTHCRCKYCFKGLEAQSMSSSVQANDKSCGSAQSTPLITQHKDKQVEQPKHVTVPKKRTRESTIKPNKKTIRKEWN